MLVIVFTLSFAFLTPYSVNAQDDGGSDTTVNPGSGDLDFTIQPPEASPVFSRYAQGPLSLQNILDVATEVRNFLMIIGIVAIVSFIVWSGIIYISAGGDEGRIAAAKQKLLWAIIGAAIILAVFIITETIRVVLNQRTFFPEV